MEKARKKRLIVDAIVVTASICIAIAFARSEHIDTLMLATEGYYGLTSFITGIFFTSAFTTAPAIAVLAKLTLAHSPLAVALFGGFGALLGDLIIFSFIKGHVRKDVAYLLSKSRSGRLRHILERRYARWSLAILGALIIASPLPDELGLAFMGLSNIRTSRFALISFTFNVIGILLIAFIARSI